MHCAHETNPRTCGVADILLMDAATGLIGLGFGGMNSGVNEIDRWGISACSMMRLVKVRDDWFWRELFSGVWMGEWVECCMRDRRGVLVGGKGRRCWIDCFGL